MRTVRYTAVSIVDVHRLVRIGKVIEPPAHQSFFRKGAVQCTASRHPPIAFPTVCSFTGYPFGKSQSNKFPLACPWQFPLLPDAHSYTPVQPPIETVDRVLHACNAIIVHPTSDIDPDLLETWSDALTAFTGRVFAQTVFELLHRLRMNSDINALSVLPQREDPAEWSESKGSTEKIFSPFAGGCGLGSVSAA